MKKKYWETVWQCRDYLVSFMRKEEIWFCDKQAEVPYPKWNRIDENGAIGLVCECDGLPTSIMTPFGGINFVSRKIGFPRISDQERELFMQKLKEEFGLKLMTERNVNGKIHPVYSITMVPWSGEVLPLLVEKETSDEELDKEFWKAKKMYEKMFNTKLGF